MRYLLLLSLVVLLAACDTATVTPPPQGIVPDAGLTLTADRNAYRSGGTAHLALHNASRDRLTTGVLECARLEVWNGRSWAVAPEREERVCIAVALYVEPGGTVRGIVPLHVRPGTYRAVHGASVETGGSRRVATAPFRVR